MDLFFFFTSAHYVALVAGKLSDDGLHPRYLNISGLSPPASSSSLDPASFSFLEPASTLLPQAPAGYCGLCIIEAPGGIRLVYWVCISSAQFLPALNHFPRSQGMSQQQSTLSIPSCSHIAPALGSEERTLLDQKIGTSSSCILLNLTPRGKLINSAISIGTR